MIKGIDVLLHVRTQTGEDAANAPIYTDTLETVGNVLVTPTSSDDIVQSIQLYGKKAEYELCIPKGDTHIWQDTLVEFFGQTWETVGFPRTYIEDNVPLLWNTKVKVARYG